MNKADASNLSEEIRLSLSLRDELRSIALKIVDDWHAAKRNPETEDLMLARFAQATNKRIEARIAEYVEQLVVEKIGAAAEQQAIDIADKLIDRWANTGEVSFEEPTPKIKAALESALTEYDGRHRIFQSAARQRKIQALALHEAKVPIGDISRRLRVTNRTAKAWIEHERAELEDLKKTLSVYGYEAVKRPV